MSKPVVQLSVTNFHFVIPGLIKQFSVFFFAIPCFVGVNGTPERTIITTVTTITDYISLLDTAMILEVPVMNGTFQRIAFNMKSKTNIWRQEAS